MTVCLTIYEDNLTGGLQLSIEDENGGYRIFGPKFAGDSKLIRRHEINERDAKEIGAMLARTGGSAT